MEAMYVTPCRRAVVNLEAWGDGDWYVRDVFTVRPARGEGLMRGLMSTVLKDADAEGVTLFLDVGNGRDSDEGMTQPQLYEWYERLGFTHYGGRRMVREQVADPTRVG